MGKDLKELAGDVVGAVFDLGNHLEEAEGLEVYDSAGLERVRKIIYDAIPDYPQSQIELVIACLVEAATMDTAKEAEEAMKEE